MPWIEEWYNYVSNVFLRSYMQTVKECKILPQKAEDFSVLFNLFLLEKAVYELGYELNNVLTGLRYPSKA